MNKKILILLMLSTIQLFALRCTQEQYSPYFTDVKEERYILAAISSYGNKSILDKASAKYDNKNIVKAWFIDQLQEQSNFDIIKSFIEFNIEDDTFRFIQHVGFKCNGQLIDSVFVKDTSWGQIPPESVFEKRLETLKKYLKIK